MNSGLIQFLPLFSVPAAFPRKCLSESPVYFFVWGHLAPVRCASGATCLQSRSISSEQVFLRNHQITQGAGDEQPMSVLIQPAVADLVETKLPFDYAELMLNACPNPRLVSVSCTFIFGQLAIAAPFGLGKVFGARRVIGDDLLLAGVGRVAPYPGFFTVKQVRQDLRIVDIGCGRYHRVDESGSAVDTDMGLHTEVPLVALARLFHFRVTLLLSVFGGAWSVDDAGINNSAPGHFHSIVLEILIHQVEQLVAQVVLFHQMAELADGRLIRRRLSPEIDAYKLAQRLGIIKSFLRSRIREIEPVLQEVNSQHPLNADRASAGALRLGIEGLDSFTQFLPGDDGFHFLKELFLASFLAVFLETAFRKRVLTHGERPEMSMTSIMNENPN